MRIPDADSCRGALRQRPVDAGGTGGSGGVGDEGIGGSVGMDGNAGMGGGATGATPACRKALPDNGASGADIVAAGDMGGDGGNATFAGAAASRAGQPAIGVTSTL